MKYYVQHKHGVSKDYNTFNQYPWHGAGQGAADAALQYIALSDFLIDTYHSKIQPWIIKDPTMKAFIDDVAMSVGGKAMSLEALTQCAQTQLQWWTQLIQASGSALNPQKCCCVIYSWNPDSYSILHLSPTIPENVAIATCPDQPQQTIQLL